MRITFILPGTGISGGVRSTFELANHLHGRGHDVSVVYSDLPSRAEVKWTPKEILIRLKKIAKGIEYNNSVDWFDLKARLIKVPTLANRYIPRGDIVVATWWGNAYDVESYSGDRGEKFYFVRHYETWGGPKDKVDGSYRLGLRKIVTSTWLKNIIEENFSAATFGPLPNGINPKLFYRETEGFESHGPGRVGMLYRQLEWKGMKDGFKAFSIARKQFPEIQLVLFGDSLADEDQRIVNDIGDVEFHEAPYKDELRRIYNSLDIFVFPSHHEGFGNPPMEAMACGAACITTEVGGVPDYIIAGKTALVSEIKNPEDLAEKILRLLRNEKERRQTAEQGYNHIQKFTWNNTAVKLEQIFAKYVNEK